MIIQKFKNRNFNIQRDRYDDKEKSLVESLLDSAELDFEIANDEDGNPLTNCSCGNFGTVTTLYNTNTNRYYPIIDAGEHTDACLFKQGKLVKLIGNETI